MTKKSDKKERAEQERHEGCGAETCASCDAKRRYEIALLNAELIIDEAEEREKC